ncbi:MAG TPA: ATP-dependent helicase, partial [bacterium]|nr:ATP-dependent helicase [bacterium]
MQPTLQFTTSDPIDKILVGLNDEQVQAVTHKNGPLLIIAGAGTGKTTVVTKRIAYLINSKLAKPSEILALTFTEKAASEMEERTDTLIPYGFTDMWISTFHAFGDRLLRDHALELGLPANFKVLTATEQAIFMRQNLYAFDLKYYRPIANPLTHVEAMLSHFSRLKDELITPEQYIRFAQVESSKLKVESGDEQAEAEKLLELANAYARYQELMLQNGNLDFGDQMYLTYNLLKNNGKVRKTYQERFKYILVDEFQDTNYAQNEIVKLLAEKSQNITVVGDDDQSIYRFRGASISNILDFGKTYPDYKQIVLNRNYRSSQEILDSSYSLIQNNNPDRLEVQNKIDKRLISAKHGPSPELMHCTTLSCEADMVVEKIKFLKKEAELSHKDFAILVRANSHAEPFIQALNVAGIPYVFSGSGSLFNFPEIKILIAFLKCLAYTDDNLSLYQIATSNIYKITHETMSDLFTKAKRGNRPVSDLISNAAASREGDDGLVSLFDDLTRYRLMKNEPVGEVLYAYLQEKQLLKELISIDSIENQSKLEHIAKFFDRISQFNHTSTERGTLSFLTTLEFAIEAGDEGGSFEIDPEIDAVNIMTAHASKGLEWPVVFIANCVANRFPSRRKNDPL